MSYYFCIDTLALAHKSIFFNKKIQTKWSGQYFDAGEPITLSSLFGSY